MHVVADSSDEKSQHDLEHDSAPFGSTITPLLVQHRYVSSLEVVDLLVA